MKKSDMLLSSGMIGGGAATAIGLIGDVARGFEGGLSVRTIVGACVIVVAASVAAMRGLRRLQERREAAMNSGPFRCSGQTGKRVNKARQYQCTWSEYFANPGTRVVDIEYFLDPDMRVPVEYTRRVNVLDVGQEIRLYEDELIVKRIA